tara:strand:- start:4157 stop:4369 length:213 start_codon:yes stop_codon:yes gene_type:complete
MLMKKVLVYVVGVESQVNSKKRRIEMTFSKDALIAKLQHEIEELEKKIERLECYACATQRYACHHDGEDE